MKKRFIIAIARVSIAMFFAGFSVVSAGTMPDVPEALKVPANQVLFLETQAAGVQIYECRASKDDPTRFEWIFKAPEAQLFDDAGKKIGRHYAGPTWESNDGSKVVGEVRAQDKGPDPTAIPWLLLTTKSDGPEGAFSKVTSVQRVSTVGGVAPKAGCSQAAAGTTARVNYTADYYFFISK